MYGRKEKGKWTPLQIKMALGGERKKWAVQITFTLAEEEGRSAWGREARVGRRR